MSSPMRICVTHRFACFTEMEGEVDCRVTRELFETACRPFAYVDHVVDHSFFLEGSLVTPSVRRAHALAAVRFVRGLRANHGWNFFPFKCRVDLCRAQREVSCLVDDAFVALSETREPSERFETGFLVEFSMAPAETGKKAGAQIPG